MWQRVLGWSLLLVAACRHPAPAAGGTAPPPGSRAAEAATAPDSVVELRIVFRGAATVVEESGRAVLRVGITVWNARADSVRLSAAPPNGCPPPVYLRPRGQSAWVRWSYTATFEPPVCDAIGLLIWVPPDSVRELPPWTFPVRAVRGDSLPAGWYEVAVGGVSWETRSAGPGSRGTPRVPAGQVWLP